ncbi:DUF6364 family protein [Haloferula sargassicola]|uniref:Ribbon-helix-helix protein CopG domain-containing protein n=1 Tax=Haloferula sargassicola TaxID=490096 RepID=A0ABP9USB0_9BACT
MAKLTLHVPDDLVTAAKQEAEHRKTSVSKLVSDYFRAFRKAPLDAPAAKLPPVTASLVGCITDPGDDRDAYIDHLERKHS